MKRRQFAAVTLGAASGAALIKTYVPKHVFARDQRPKRSRVAILSVEGYSDKLDALVCDGLRLFGLDVKGKTVLLKPNLVEYIAGVDLVPVPSSVLSVGQFSRALMGHSCQAPKCLVAQRLVVSQKTFVFATVSQEGPAGRVLAQNRLTTRPKQCSNNVPPLGMNSGRKKPPTSSAHAIS